MKDFNIIIGKTKWSINFVDAGSIFLPNSEYGITLYKKAQIYIDKNLKYDIMKQTILHEIFHAILCESGFEIKTQEFFSGMYETYVDSVSRYFDCFKELYNKMENKNGYNRKNKKDVG